MHPSGISLFVIRENDDVADIQLPVSIILVNDVSCLFGTVLQRLVCGQDRFVFIGMIFLR